MEVFKVRKNGNPSAYMGSVSSNYSFIPAFDRVRVRILLYGVSALTMINIATGDYIVIDEITYHGQPPPTRTHFENSVPK
jgi:hypothetical protein